MQGLLEARVQDRPDLGFLTFGDRRLRLGELADAAGRLAGGFRSLGVERGDRVALMLPNCVEFVLAWFALARMGGVMVPINPLTKGDGLRYILEHSGSRALVVDVDAAPEAAATAGSLPEPPRLVHHGEGVHVEGPGGEAPSVADLLEHPTPPAEPLADDDPMAILYTSGTTGPPKGVVIPQNSYVRAGREFVERTIGAVDGDVLFTALPLFHVNAQQLTTMGALHAGLPMVLSERFSVSGFWNEIREAGATVFNYIGAMLALLVKAPPDDDDLDNPVRVTFGGGVPADVWVAFEERFGVKVVEGYGLTETATVCMTNPLAEVKVGTIGKPVSWAEAMVVDERDRPVPAGTPGEIVVRSTEPDVMMLGYHSMPDQTAEAMRGGWFHTGDRGREDDEGYFIFIDRLKDSIRRRGENISSFQVERAVNKHPAVLESAAVGVPSELGEEDVRIVVVLRPGASLAPEDLLDHCQRELSSFMVPRYVEFRPELPKTPTQRVQKFALRAEGASDSWDREAHGYRLNRSVSR